MDSIDTSQLAKRLFIVLWTWIALRTALPWLVFFRLTFEGDSYTWGTSYFGQQFYSSGLARPDFLVIYLLLACGLSIIWLLRQYRLRLVAPVMTGYLGVFAADALFELVGGEPIIFRGDTLDVTLNVSAVYFTLQFGMLALGLCWWWSLRGIESVTPAVAPAWKSRAISTCIAIVPVQLMLLMTGEPHGLTDEAGVILTLLQWGVLAVALYPGGVWHRRDASFLSSSLSRPGSRSAA